MKIHSILKQFIFITALYSIVSISFAVPAIDEECIKHEGISVGFAYRIEGWQTHHLHVRRHSNNEQVANLAGDEYSNKIQVRACIAKHDGLQFNVNGATYDTQVIKEYNENPIAFTCVYDITQKLNCKHCAWNGNIGSKPSC